MGLKGESHSDDSVWVAKSHHPFYIKGAVPNMTNKTFICIRNPLDVFPSYAALCNTLSHGNKPEFDFAVDYPEWWDWFIRKQAKQMQKFFEILIRNCTNENKQPLYIVRYEDLVTSPKDTLMNLMSFLLEEKDLNGTNVERRIDDIVAQGSSAAQTYKLKSTTGQFNVHQAKYSVEQKQFIQDTLGSQLYYFGYANCNDNPTGFFEFPEHSAENLALHDKFRADSADALNFITSDEGRVNKNYTHNTGEVFDVMDEEDLTKILEPAYDYARKTIQMTKDETAAAQWNEIEQNQEL